MSYISDLLDKKRLEEQMLATQNYGNEGRGVPAPTDPYAQMGRDELNRIMSQSTGASPGFYAPEPAPAPQRPTFDPNTPPPLNSFRNNTTGKVTDMSSSAAGQGNNRALPLGDFLEKVGANINDKVIHNGKMAYRTPDGELAWQNANGSIGRTVSPVSRETMDQNKYQMAMDTAKANLAHTNAQTQKDVATTAKMTYEQGLLTAPPTEQQQARVQAILDGRDVLSPRERSTPQGQALMNQVVATDPSFDMVNYNARAATRKDFTSGKSAENIKSLNTAIGHLGTLSTNFDKLNNSDYPLYNKVANTLGNAMGNKAIQESTAAVGTDALAVAGEMAKVFRSVGMSQAEIQHWREKITPDMPPAAMKSVINEAADLMNSRLHAVGDQYNKGMGTTKQPLEMLAPEARATMEALQSDGKVKKGGGPQVGTVQDGYIYLGGDPGNRQSWKQVQ